MDTEKKPRPRIKQHTLCAFAKTTGSYVNITALREKAQGNVKKKPYINICGDKYYLKDFEVKEYINKNITIHYE